jgi:hypothetical protein
VSRIDQWHRLHRTPAPVTLCVVASPVTDGDWLVRTHGWDLPQHTPVLYESLEAAQRAADDVLINYRPHDCRLQGCGDWVPIKGPTQNGPERLM